MKFLLNGAQGNFLIIVIKNFPFRSSSSTLAEMISLKGQRVLFAIAWVVLFSPALSLAKVSSQLKFTPTYYAEDLSRGTTQSAVPITSETEFTFKFSKNWRSKITPYLYSDPSSKSDREKFLFDFTQASLSRRFGDSSLDIGLNQISWGVTDVFNPLDVVSARRYFDPLNTEKRGVPSLVFGHESGDWLFEALYVPIQLETLLPGEQSRWLPREIFLTENAEFEIHLPEVLRYHYLERDEVEAAMQNGFGFRVDKRGSGTDLSAVFYQGASATPSILAIVTGDYIPRTPPQRPIYRADADVQLQPIYYQRRTIGLAAVHTLETAILKLAGAYSDRVSDRSDLPGWNHSLVFGWEQNIPVADSTLTALLQATYGKSQTTAGNSVSSFDRIFDQSFLLGLRLTTSSDWSATLAALYDSIGKGSLSQLKIEKKLSDGLTATLEGDIIEGATDTALGSYRRNDRAALGLTAYF